MSDSSRILSTIVIPDRDQVVKFSLTGLHVGAGWSQTRDDARYLNFHSRGEVHHVSDRHQKVRWTLRDHFYT